MELFEHPGTLELLHGVEPIGGAFGLADTNKQLRSIAPCLSVMVLFRPPGSFRTTAGQQTTVNLYDMEIIHGVICLHGITDARPAKTLPIS
jgi:hypothetical protein